MINPTNDDLNSGVVCKFQGGEITGILTSFNPDSVIVQTKRGEQFFSREECEWQNAKKAKAAAAPAEPVVDKPLV